MYEAVLAHPFVAGLTDGSLERDVFSFYVVQDAHFLREYARALSVTGARARSEREITMFNRHAVETLEAERALHESFYDELELSEELVAATPMAPTNVAYTSFLLATAHAASFGEAVGTLLPCYWIYWEVGNELARRGSPDALYQRWIDTYSSDDFGAVVDDVRGLVDSIATELSGPARDGVKARFLTASRFEWMFWEMGWRREDWPVG